MTAAAAACPNCSTPLQPAARFCPRCGTNVAGRAAAPAYAPPAHVASQPTGTAPGGHDVLFAAGGLTVTPTAVTLPHGVTLATHAIAAFDLAHRRTSSLGGQLFRLVFGLAVLFAGARAIGYNACGGTALLALGALFALKGLGGVAGYRSHHVLTIVAVNGQRHTVTAKRREDLEPAAAALARVVGRR